MPKAIVTGATGYIGSHVVRRLLKEGWEVSIIADPKFGYNNIVDIQDKLIIFKYDNNISELIGFFREQNADVVMHLAAAVITNHTPDKISTLISSNVEFGTQILEAMRFCETRLFIGTGTFWQSYNEEAYNPVDLYAATKEAFEKILKYYVEAHGLRAITLRLHDVCGEDDIRPKLWTILKSYKEGDLPIDMTAGEQLIDLVHIEDVSKAYIKAYELFQNNSDIKNKIYNVSTGHPLSLKETVNIFEKISSKKIEINWGAKDYNPRIVMFPYQGIERLPNWTAEIAHCEMFKRFNNQ